MDALTYAISFFSVIASLPRGKSNINEREAILPGELKYSYLINSIQFRVSVACKICCLRVLCYFLDHKTRVGQTTG